MKPTPHPGCPNSAEPMQMVATTQIHTPSDQPWRRSLTAPRQAKIAVPAAIQNSTTYAGAVASDTAHPEAARSLLAAMTGPDAAAQLAAKGMTPPR